MPTKKKQEVSNQPLKFHGGKSYLASWLHSLAPKNYTHRNIVFAGGLGEFWNWPHDGVAETVNDTNEELINFYFNLANELRFKDFSRVVNLTPFGRKLYTDSYDLPEPMETTDELQWGSITRAVNFFLKYRMSRQGLGKDYATPTTRTRRGMNENVSAYLSAVDGLAECHERLRSVELECLDFRDFIAQRDHKRALFYCDPPYMRATRTSGGEYHTFETSDNDHLDLLDQLSSIDGKFMLSGYMSKTYAHWARKHKYECHQLLIDKKSSSKKKKDEAIECVWTNY